MNEHFCGFLKKIVSRMGAYLSQPKTDKASTDEFNEFLTVGTSSMQGWRNSQEDAHNSILNYDKNTSFFAVYDGHGGAEVAQYCADKFPEFLKGHNSYQLGQLEEALKEAFLGFDKTLLDPPVVSLLKILAGEHNLVDADAEEEEDDDVEDLIELREESHLPLNEVLEKYKGLPQTHDLVKMQSDSNEGFKHQSPYLRGRRAAAVAAEAANKAVMDPLSRPEGSSTSAAAAAALAGIDNSSSNQSVRILEKGADISKTNANITEDCVIAKPHKSNQNGCVTTSEVKCEGDSNNKNVTNIEGSLESGCNKIEKLKPNGTEITNIMYSSSNKESEKLMNEMTTFPSEEESTDDDDDYAENDKNADILTEESSDDDIESTNNDEENEDDDDASDDEMDEDQMANDNFCANMIEEPGKDSGCTAVVCLLHGRELFVANAGDSRCVVSRSGRAIEMSIDHKPEDEAEATRIVNAGGRVTLDGRVNGGLNLSRALGDHAYKTNLELPAEAQMISALPDVKKLLITPEDEFMILACDGIWNYMSSEEVVEFVRLKLKDENRKLSQICEELFDNCLAPNTMGDGTGCDNMTAVIVKFGKKLHELETSINQTDVGNDLVNMCKGNTNTINKQSFLKRCASPDAVAGVSALNNSNKRLKTEDRVLEPVDTASEFVSGNSDSQTESTAVINANEITIAVSPS
ncbi:probable protein phosphatase CG10417 isoform X2 [Drosophila ananassae]|nr:probable protein phosphatase CG10417 isoform X2 [Drosophila ananassae]